jgi:hypothetical protein
MTLNQDHDGMLRLDKEKKIIYTGNGNGQIATLNVIDYNV